MTLILGLYVKWHAIQVSDRLVSLNSIPPSPFDALANKTVIYFGRRGIVSISAAGLAYLNGKTIDTWIAETLSGVDLSIQSALAMGRSPGRSTALFRSLVWVQAQGGEAHESALPPHWRR